MERKKLKRIATSAAIAAGLGIGAEMLREEVEDTSSQPQAEKMEKKKRTIEHTSTGAVARSRTVTREDAGEDDKNEVARILEQKIASALPRSLVIEVAGRNEEEIQDAYEKKFPPEGGYVIEHTGNDEEGNILTIKRIEKNRYQDGEWMFTAETVFKVLDTETVSYQLNAFGGQIDWSGNIIDQYSAETTHIDDLPAMVREAVAFDDLFFQRSLSGYDQDLADDNPNLRRQILEQQIQNFQSLADRHWQYLIVPEDTKKYFGQTIADWKMKLSQVDD